MKKTAEGDLCCFRFAKFGKKVDYEENIIPAPCGDDAGGASTNSGASE